MVQGLKYSKIYILAFSKSVLLIYLDNSSAPAKTMHPHCSWWQSRISLLSPQLSTLQLPLDSPPQPVIKDIRGKKKPNKTPANLYKAFCHLSEISRTGPFLLHCFTKDSSHGGYKTIHGPRLILGLREPSEQVIQVKHRERQAATSTSPGGFARLGRMHTE